MISRALFVRIAAAVALTVTTAGCRDTWYDARIEKEVTARLAADPKAADVKVKSRRQIVILEGSVEDLDERQRVNALARSVHGVLGVEDHLGVQPKVSTTGAEIDAGATDREIADKIRRTLDSAGITGVEVEVQQGSNVILRGDVPRAKRDAAVGLAYTADPRVKYVENQLLEH